MCNGFVFNTLRRVLIIAVGLISFELVRRKLGARGADCY